MQRFVPGGSVYFGLHVPKNNTTDLTKQKKKTLTILEMRLHKSLI